jgi:Tol biopolymer transport system component
VTKDGSNARKRAAREHAATHQMPYTQALRDTAQPPRARVRPPVPIRTSDTTLVGHSSRVVGVAFHPDGTMFASAGDRSVRLWDRTTLQTTTVLNTDDSVFSMAWSPDGATIAVGCVDGTVTFWTVATGRIISRTTGANILESVAFSPQGDTAATSGFERHDETPRRRSVARLWDVATGQDTLLSDRDAELRQDRLVGHGYALAFHPAGRVLAASGETDGSLHLWDLPTRHLTELPGHDGYSIMALDFSPDGRTLASGGMDDTILLWDTTTWRHTRRIDAPAGLISRMAFSPDGRLLAATGMDLFAQLWDVRTGEPVAVLLGHDGEIPAFAFSPDGRLLVTGSDDRTLRLWHFD